MWVGIIQSVEGPDGTKAEKGQAVYAAINCMLDQVNACLDHLEDRNDHLPGRLREEAPSDWQPLVEPSKGPGARPLPCLPEPSPPGLGRPADDLGDRPA
ncbi:hypothetical protein K5549_003237 [Capra hircus]|nr:hypothetical protein K5549_003128 [Capra hircus]KAJ1057620.1 hypothetical protein K5549_003237 [Capra hircus]